ncbi:MAG: hypothetical protein PHS41_01990 [Victivallaceae bacterium]|nr:hypothetical protein [Victivallaceae bacterium]
MIQQVISLDGTWLLTYAEGNPINSPEEYTAELCNPSREMIPAAVPSPIHRVLQERGWIDDPNFGMNSLKARWVEECFWIYRRTFEVPVEATQPEVCARLVFDRIEMLGKVYCNGKFAGETRNALVPQSVDLTGLLLPGKNTLIVQVESGVFACADKPTMHCGSGEAGFLTKRVHLRKSQHQSGWDWHPRLQLVGILGSVRLEYATAPMLLQATLRPQLNEDLSSGRITALFTFERGEHQTGTVSVGLTVEDTPIKLVRKFEIPVGRSTVELSTEIANPKLWNPVGCGEPSRYTAVLSAGRERKVRKFGFRKVRIDQSAHPEGGQFFILEINNRRVFCKGGNFVPADLYYSEVTPARYRRLAEIARDENFNLLRIWGGGIYMTEEFADICDELGLLVWHDFIFACAKYPGEQSEFVDLVREEARWQTRELGSHPSLVVWSGNNELETGNWNWYKGNPVGWTDHAIFHHDLAKIVHDDAPQTFYWPSSPYSPEFRNPNDPTIGDQHPWSVALDSPGGTDFRLYRDFIDRFPNEGGVLGASPEKTIRGFLPEGEQRLFSPSFDHHDNTFARRDFLMGHLGHCYQTIQLWTGRDPLTMELAEYAAASGVLQAEGLEEYIHNYRRRMFSSAAAIFWMFNDSWPTSNSWTTIDYYCRRKLSYFPVKRAFAPVTLTVADCDGMVKIFGVNDSEKSVSALLRFGIFKTGAAGKLVADHRREVTLPANASTVLAEFPADEWTRVASSGVFALLERDHRLLAEHRLFRDRFKALVWSHPAVAIRNVPGGVELTSPDYVWKCCIDLDGEREIADNAFDLYPGIPRFVASASPVEVKFTGNCLFS